MGTNGSYYILLPCQTNYLPSLLSFSISLLNCDYIPPPNTILVKIQFLLFFTPMMNPESASIQSDEEETHVYSVWALPPEDVSARIENLMKSLRSEFGGPLFEPHITVVGAIRLTAEDALTKFRTACQGIKAYQATVDHVTTGTFFYQCVFLLIHPTTEVLPSHLSALPFRLLRFFVFPLFVCLILLSPPLFFFFFFPFQVVETSSHFCKHFDFKSSTRKFLFSC